MMTDHHDETDEHDDDDDDDDNSRGVSVLVMLIDDGLKLRAYTI